MLVTNFSMDEKKSYFKMMSYFKKMSTPLSLEFVNILPYMAEGILQV